MGRERRNRPATHRPPWTSTRTPPASLLADLPGVSKDGLSIKVQSDELLIEGEAAVRSAGGVRLVHNELREPLFRRSFTLSHDLDRASPPTKHGVLTLRIAPARSSGQNLGHRIVICECNPTPGARRAH